MSGAFLFIFTLIWSGMVLMFDGFMAHGVYKQFESQKYPSVAGTITHSEVTSHSTSKGGTSYTAVISYRYEVDGQKFEGSKLRFGTTVSSSEYARAAVNAYPLGSTAQVFYNPASPQESLLSPGVNGSDFMLGLFLTPFNMVMLGLWIWIGGWLRERFFRPVAGGVKIFADGMTTRVRLPQISPIVWGLGTTGGLAFVSIFIVGIGAKMEPSNPLILSVIAAVYGAGMAVYLRQRQKINSGIDDLVINEPSRTIELPLTFGRQQRETVKITDIKSLSVEKIEHRSNKGGISYTYAPTLGLHGTGTAVQKLADWSDKLKADEFTGWLRKQLGTEISATLDDPAVDGANEFNPGATIQVPVEEIRRDENSRIKVTDGPDGREFYFPAARNIGTTIYLTIMFLVWTGFTLATYFLFKSLLFEIIFTAADVLIFFTCLNLWLKSSRIAIDSTGVRVTRHWLLFSRSRNFAADDIDRFEIKTGMTSGKIAFQDIKLITKNSAASFAASREKFRQTGQKPPLEFRVNSPGGFTVASGIASAPEAAWLVREMTRALGRQA